MRGRYVRGTLLLVMLVTAAVALPGAGQTKPPQDDGSGYTWAGASILTVDVKPWGAGYVRSDPYFVDCPLACIRPLERGRELTLVAHVTPGHKFESWEGACAGQGNPCKLTASSAAVDVTAVYSGQYVPPQPPSTTGSVSPALTVVDSPGECPQCFTTVVSGTGFHPNSPISITFVFSSPSTGDQAFTDVETSDAAGSWSQGFYEPCIFDGIQYVGPVDALVVATDAEGASATGSSSRICPEQPTSPSMSP